MFELADLEKLVCVFEEGTLSAAAEKLHISQPALTRAMQKLEDEFGCELFTRTKNRAELNENGLLAVSEAKKVLDAAKRMSERMADRAKSLISVRIGSCAPGPMWVAEEKLAALEPNAEISAELSDNDKLLRGLYEDKYQLIITTEPVKSPGVVTQEFLTESLSVSLPPSHQLAKKDGVWIRELKGQTMLLFSELGVWQKLCDEKMQGVRFIVQSEIGAFTDLIYFSVLPNFDSSLSEGRVEPPLNRVRVPLLDPEATMIFYISALKKHKRLMAIS